MGETLNCQLIEGGQVQGYVVKSYTEPLMKNCFLFFNRTNRGPLSILWFKESTPGSLLVKAPEPGKSLPQKNCRGEVCC